MNLNIGENLDLSVLKNKILTIEDVYDYCLVDGKFWINFIIRSLFSKMQRIYSRFLLPIYFRKQKGKLF